MNSEVVEAVGKVGIGIVSIVCLTWILYTVLTQNTKALDALADQTVVAQRQADMAERQTKALERLVEVYSGVK